MKEMQLYLDAELKWVIEVTPFLGFAYVFQVELEFSISNM